MGGENMANKDEKYNVAHNIKEGAGAAFHATHNALEATENAAMSTVDKTAKAADHVMKKGNNKK